MNFRSVKVLCVIVVMDTCHYAFFQTPRMYSTKGESQGKLWTLDDDVDGPM